MLFFNIPNIFHFGNDVRQGYESRYERKIGRDSRNIAILEPLETALGKIEDIRVRVGTRIEKEVASGTDMTVPVDLLNSADQTLATAEQAVAIATSTVTSDRPRAPYMETQQAYSALNQSRDSLNSVLDAIVVAVDQASSTTATSTHAKKRQ